jgi:hypothetical protein
VEALVPRRYCCNHYCHHYYYYNWQLATYETSGKISSHSSISSSTTLALVESMSENWVCTSGRKRFGPNTTPKLAAVILLISCERAIRCRKWIRKIKTSLLFSGNFANSRPIDAFNSARSVDASKRAEQLHSRAHSLGQ